MPSKELQQVKIFSMHLNEPDKSRDEAAINHFLSTATVKRVATSIVYDGEQPRWSVLVFYEAAVDKPATAKETKEEVTLTAEEQPIYDALSRWRMAQATKEGVPPYAIAHNAWLKQIVRICPHTLADLGHIEGLGDRRIEKYGEQILAVLGNFHN